nr:hypothetical protein [Candidatus Electrothrix aestuarii]
MPLQGIDQIHPTQQLSFPLLIQFRTLAETPVCLRALRLFLCPSLEQPPLTNQAFMADIQQDLLIQDILLISVIPATGFTL